VGPHEVRLEGFGVQPDVVMELTQADLVAGRDPQLAAAERVLLGRLMTPD
jgi:C-terminal processing protease CtpA/Prc